MAERENNVIEFPSPSLAKKMAKGVSEARSGPQKKRVRNSPPPARNPARRATDFPSDSTSLAAKNRPGDAVILAQTGKTWRQWFVLLNACGTERSARKKIIVANTSAKPSWRALVLISYELDTAKREQYVQPGGYEVSVSRNVNVPVETLFTSWTDESLRESWLGKKKLTILDARVNESLEIAWEGGLSCLMVKFQQRAANKSRVVIKHRGLPQRQISDMKGYWGTALKALAERRNTA